MASMANCSFQLLFIFLPLFLMFLSLEANRFSSNVGCIEMERKALVEFKKGLKDPSGLLSSSWVGKDCCRWMGVGCSNQTGNVVTLDLRNLGNCFEQKINAYNSFCLGGEVSSSLLDLKYLNYLDLSMNDFQWIPIPNFLGSLEKLTYLNLSTASFGGMIPPHLGNLSNLRYLDLSTFSNNNWVSDLNWLVGLSSLKFLNLGYVNLTLARANWLQALNMLPSLSELLLESCELHNLPLFVPNINFTSLSILDLSFNNFNSSIPHWLFNISTLLDLNLDYNFYLKDPVSHISWGNLCNLRTLDLSVNEISGDISELIGGLSRCSNSSLENLYLQDNQVSGQLPDYSLAHLQNLRSLRLSNNSISGPIPASIGRLSKLEELDLSVNQMNGSIPDGVGKLANLNWLMLDNNFWEGVLSQNHLQGLTKLEFFYISCSKRSFIFNMSHEWVPPFSLKEIGINNCVLGPRFPAWLSYQKQLFTISLIDVGISDTIPDWLCEVSPQIQWLDLSGNRIHGMLPNSLVFSLGAMVDLSSNCLEGSLPHWPNNVSILLLANNLFSGSIPVNIGQMMSLLNVLDLSGNFLNGSIPLSIGKMKYLTLLSLSNNYLSGRIHDKWMDLQWLQFLDLSRNNLQGEIPGSICSLPQLFWLKLGSNNLSGELSFVLQNCKGLMTLDLGENRFSGNIPKFIGESYLSLSELRIRANMFSGNIPEQLCSLSHLHILDLAFNNLSGSIPSCLGNLDGLSSLTSYFPHQPSSIEYSPQIEMELVVKGRQMIYTFTLKLVNIIDLSSNNLQGEIPELITNLLTLGTLNLSHNQLTGNIPEKIGGLQRLETLDLSCNHLSGPIPPTMSSITSLDCLNLSFNNLSGQIPFVNQFLTLNDPSIYEGNSELCGPPLLTKCPTPNDRDADGNQDAKAYKDEDENENLGFYLGMALGFVVGFWAVCGSLVLKKSWRYAYFRCVSKMSDWVSVVILVNLNRLRRMMESEQIESPMKEIHVVF